MAPSVLTGLPQKQNVRNVLIGMQPFSLCAVFFFLFLLINRITWGHPNMCLKSARTDSHIKMCQTHRKAKPLAHQIVWWKKLQKGQSFFSAGARQRNCTQIDLVCFTFVKNVL